MNLNQIDEINNKLESINDCYEKNILLEILNIFKNNSDDSFNFLKNNERYNEILYEIGDKITYNNDNTLKEIIEILKQEFGKKLLLTYYGCDGGNIDAKFWFCGIEWGYAKKSKKEEESEYLKRVENGFLNDFKTLKHSFESKDLIDKFQLPINAAYDFRFGKFSKFPWEYELSDYNNFTLFMGQLLLAIHNVKICLDDKLNKTNRDIIKEKVKNVPIFKLNLFPLAFPTTSKNKINEKIEKIIQKFTGYKNKEDYLNDCFSERSNLLGKINNSNGHKKIIICTGSGEKIHFNDVFGNNTSLPEPNIDSEDKYVKYYYRKVDEKTLLFIIPFLGKFRYCLKNDSRIFLMAEHIRKIIIQEEFQECLYSNLLNSK
jgi:hypothetical protein